MTNKFFIVTKELLASVDAISLLNSVIKDSEKTKSLSNLSSWISEYSKMIVDFIFILALILWFH